MKALVVETQRIKDNLKIVKEIINSDEQKVTLIAVVKGNGYGLGLVEYTQFLADSGIGIFAVATVQEAVKLRKNGIKQDILMLSSTEIKEDIEELIQKDIILTIGSKSAAKIVDEVAQSQNKKARAHIKVDTGFGRYGFIYNQKEEMIEAVKNLKNVEVEGMFSHFSIAFYGDGKETREQYNRFLKCVEAFKENGIEPKLLHICNSSATLRFPEMHLNAVRVGSALLGRLAIPNKWGFKKVGYLKENVAEIKTLPTGYNIGYSNSYITKKETEVAIIPLGYADGFNVKVDKDMFRPIDKLRYIVRDIKDAFKKQQIYVNINGEKCKVLGRLGMFHASVDITGKNVEINDEARFEVSPMLVDSEIKRIYE